MVTLYMSGMTLADCPATQLMYFYDLTFVQCEWTIGSLFFIYDSLSELAAGFFFNGGSKVMVDF